jgi:hypothetical protein
MDIIPFDPNFRNFAISKFENPDKRQLKRLPGRRKEELRMVMSQVGASSIDEISNRHIGSRRGVS